MASFSFSLPSARHCSADAPARVPNAVAVLAGRKTSVLPVRGSIIARAVITQTRASSKPPSTSLTKPHFFSG